MSLSISTLLRKIPGVSYLFAFNKLISSKSSYILQKGWMRSFIEMSAIDGNGLPIPWYTYPAINFLTGRVKPTMLVFEYGSGNSSHWWASQVSKVYSCEHDTVWYEKMKSRLPANVTYIKHTLEEGNNYASAAIRSGEMFDVLVIDGRQRVECIKQSIEVLKSDGIVVWDNSEREIYEEGYAFLLDKGFRRIDFSGMGPINTYGWSTSIFYRSDNCLGI